MDKWLSKILAFIDKGKKTLDAYKLKSTYRPHSSAVHKTFWQVRLKVIVLLF